MTIAAPALVVEDVWRRYRAVSAARPRGLRASLSRDPLRRHRDRWFWALRGVDLRVDRGEALALIGRNGAGKSTLLRLAGGVGRPDRGDISVIGRVGALTDLGHEFHSDLTGRQNAEVAAVVAGLTRREFRRRCDEILAFAELTDFADEPLRAYSDGMRARLAFSVMAHIDPDLLLVDETLAVGDAPFQRRSVQRIGLLIERGAAVVFVSHDLALVRTVCDHAVWLDHGEIRARGSAPDVVAQYLDSDAPEPARSVGTPGEHRTMHAVRVLDGWGTPTRAIGCGDALVVETDIARAGARAAVLRVRIVRTLTDQVLVDTSTPVSASDPGRPPEQQTLVVRFHRLDLAPGAHRVEVALFSPDWSEAIDAADPVSVAVHGDGPDTASLAPPHEWGRRTGG